MINLHNKDNALSNQIIIMEFEYIYMYVYIDNAYTLYNRIDRSYGNSMFNFLRNCQAVLDSGIPIGNL
jgi:hypothetical protein